MKLTVPRGGFGKPCLPGDTCADNLMQCAQGICTCRNGFDANGELCGKFLTFYLCMHIYLTI